MSRNIILKEILILLLHVFLIICLEQRTTNAKVQKSVYIFGDSTVDVGTNNHLKGSTATANNPYYGIDYPNSESTGRFSNGHNTADYIVSMVGDYTESPPPFLSLIKENCNSTEKIQCGVNFASGGSGILDYTGFQNFNVVIPLGQQIQQFATVRDNITKAIGEAKAQNLLQNALYLLSVGSNDLFDYKKYGSNLTAPDFIDYLGSFFAGHLEKLYNLGARKFGVIGVAPIGCCPSAREYSVDGSCMDDVNELAQNLHKSTEMLLHRMSVSFQGVHYSLGNSYNMTLPVLDPKANVFKDVKKGCCGHGRFNGLDKCSKKSYVCKDRNESLFWDWVHPTERASAMAAELLLFGGAPLVTPINFFQLAKIQV